MVMERSTGGNLESYLRNELRDKFTTAKHSERFTPEVDKLLKTLTELCCDTASAMEFLAAKRVCGWIQDSRRPLQPYVYEFFFH